jgi:hypothetical protein
VRLARTSLPCLCKDREKQSEPLPSSELEHHGAVVAGASLGRALLIPSPSSHLVDRLPCRRYESDDKKTDYPSHQQNHDSFHISSIPAGKVVFELTSIKYFKQLFYLI